MDFLKRLLKPHEQIKSQGYQDLNQSKRLPDNSPSELLLASRDVVGKRLQKKILELDECRWLRSEYTYPSFDDMNFMYKSNIYSVLIDIQDEEGVSFLPEEYIKRQLYTASTNNLIPCRFPVVVAEPHNPDLSQIKVKTEEWNLFHTETSEPVNPETVESEKPCEMSKWEMRYFGVRFVTEYLQAKQFKVVGFQDTLEVDPQIWFLDAKGKRCWVIVRCDIKKEDNTNNPADFSEIIKRCFKYDGYYSGLKLEPKTSDDKVIYRGENIKAEFDGIRKIHSVL